jgi:phosphatidylglycerol:prolipoprotein diacylglycerol transferase
MSTLFIQMPLPAHQFSFFYSAAFIAAIVVLLMEGHRRKFPMLPWILIIAFSQILFITGTKLFALAGEDWRYMAGHLKLVPSDRKELFGGMLLLVLGIWIGKRWLKFGFPVADCFALAIPLALSLQKWGCFFAGCCFGSPCELPWAVQYPVMTLPHYHQFLQGSIGQGQTFSLPVHPVQLYEGLGTLLVVFLVWHFRRKWQAHESSLLFSLSGYLIIRFLVEFIKDPMAHTSGGDLYGPMNVTQWIILPGLPVLIFILFYRERYKHPLREQVRHSEISLSAIFTFFCLSVLIFSFLAQWFTFIERMVILMVFAATAVLALVGVLRNSWQRRYKLLYAISLLLPFILMSQTLPFHPEDSVTIRKSTKFSVGLAGAGFDNSNAVYSGEGCDRVGNRAYFNQKYLVSGAGLSFRNENLTRNTETNYGFGLTFGNHTESYLGSDTTYNAVKADPNLLPDQDKSMIYGVHPFIRFDSRWVGIGGGFHLGKLSYAFHHKEVEGSGFPYTGRKEVDFYPGIYLRIGPNDIAFADYHLADHFPSAFPGYLQMIGLGTGFGSDRGYLLRIGTLIGSKDTYHGEWFFDDIPFQGLYTTGCFPLKNGFALEPLILFDYSEYSDQVKVHFSFALHYEWNQRQIRRIATLMQ